jgi:hypothetical protein
MHSDGGRVERFRAMYEAQSRQLSKDAISNSNIWDRFIIAPITVAL